MRIREKGSRKQVEAVWDTTLNPLPQLEDLITYAQVGGPLEVSVDFVGLTILVDPYTDLVELVDDFTTSNRGDTIGPCIPTNVVLTRAIAQWLLDNPNQSTGVIEDLVNVLPIASRLEVVRADLVSPSERKEMT